MLEKDKFISIGSLGRGHGVKGEISAKLDVEIDALYENSQDFFLMLEQDDLLIPYRVVALRSKHNASLIKFAKIDTKEAADKLTNKLVWLDRELLAEVDEVEFNSFSCLEGFSLCHSNGDELGVIESVDEATMNTLLYVYNEADEELIIPFSEELITKLDVENQVIYMEIPQGLLDLDRVEEI